MFNKVFMSYDFDDLHRKQAIFSSIFVMQNRMQTAGDKLQTDLSMKQWLLITMTNLCDEPCTLTNIGELMGCSRQNVKKLAVSLEKKGYVQLVSGANNSVQIQLTQKVSQYEKEIGKKQMIALNKLFADFSEEEVKQLFNLYAKLYAGIERVEELAEGKLNED